MPTTQSVRHVPWTCRWGTFGGPLAGSGVPVQGFVFWICCHPEIGGLRALDRGTCDECSKWEPSERYRNAS